MSLAVVQAIRIKYPTPLGSQHAAFLLELAPALSAAHAQEFGLLKKDGGTHIVLPDGTRVSQDVVCNRAGIQYDCLGDGEGQAIPTWNAVDPAHYTPDPSRFYAVTGTNPQPEPEPPPDNNYEERIAKLEEQVTMLARSLAAVNETAVYAKATSETALETANNGMRYTTDTREWVRQAKVKGRTGVRTFHSHDVDLGLEWE